MTMKKKKELALDKRTGEDTFTPSPSSLNPLVTYMYGTKKE